MNAWRDLKKLPRELWILSFATLVNRLGSMVLPFLVLYLTRSAGFSASRAGALLAVYGIVGLLVGPISGKLSDRWGAFRVMQSTLIAFGIVVLLFPLAHSWAAVLSMTVLLAATNEAFRPANWALIGRMGPAENKKSAFALSRMASNLGMSVGPALGGFLAQASFSLLFLVDGLTALAAAAILTFSSIRGCDGDVTIPAPRRWPLAPFLTDSNLRVLLLGIIPVLLVFWQLQSTLPLFMVRDLGFAESAYGMLFTLNTLMIITIEVPLNAATSHWPHRRTLALGSFLFAVGFGSLTFARTYLEVALTVAIWTFGEMILFPGTAAYVSGIAPEGRQGEYMGLYAMAFSFTFIAGPWIGTLILERYGATVLWPATFAVAIVSVVALGQPIRPAPGLRECGTAEREARRF
jgi:predicted MFS family arabinose efflux permease